MLCCLLLLLYVLSVHFHVLVLFYFSFFFFNQKTAYEMRISDWSSDVCSSDLSRLRRSSDASSRFSVIASCWRSSLTWASIVWRIERFAKKIGRASCRERVCQYV